MVQLIMVNQMTEFPEILTDGDLELRRIKPTFEMARVVLDVVNKNREYLGATLPWVHKTHTLEDMYDGLQHVHKNEWMYHIFLDNTFVGVLGFVRMNARARMLEVGGWLDRDSVGRMVMVRAMRMIEQIAFCGKFGDWNRIQIASDVSNMGKKANVWQRYGYVFEGVQRQVTLYNDEIFGDIAIFSKLKSEWKDRNNCAV